MKTMRVTIDIDVDDLEPSDREELARDMEEGVSELPTLADTDAREAASVLENIGSETATELFAGSDVYVRFVRFEVIDAEWITSTDNQNKEKI